MAYGAPADVQSIYDRLTPEQIQQIASGLGFTGDPNTSDYNAFVAQDPTRFEAAVRGIGSGQSGGGFMGGVEPTGATGSLFSGGGPSPEAISILSSRPPPTENRYGAPPEVQAKWDTLTPEQQTQMAQRVGYQGAGQDSAFNTFIRDNPTARNAFESGVYNYGVRGFEGPGWTGYGDPSTGGGNKFDTTPPATTTPAASNRYAAPQWAQGVWDQLKPWQQTQVANNLGYSGTGQQSAFNDYVVQNNKGADFEAMLGRINPQTFGQPMGRPTAPQGAQSYGYDTGFGYSYPSAFGGGGFGGTFGAFGQQPAAQANQTNYLSSTPTAQAPQASAFNPGHDYGTFARGSFQFRRGGRI